MGVRKFLISHVAEAIREEASDGAEPAADEPKKLEKGMMRLYTYYKPGLRANRYVIEVEQSISAINEKQQTEKLTVKNVRKDGNGVISNSPQEFTVVVPRFTIDRSIINSYYPPDGHQDEGRILPHIVFNDPHFPWEIPAGEGSLLQNPIDNDRNLVPWVAVLVFDVDELRFGKEELQTMKNYKLQGFNEEADLAKQNVNGTFAMAVKDYIANVPPVERNAYEQEDSIFTTLSANTDQINVIFPTKTLIRKVVGQHLNATTSANNTTGGSGVDAFKYLAHVRHINTEDCPDATVKQQGIFSVVTSPRTGPLYDKPVEKEVMKQPRTQVCHLVTIEHLGATIEGWTVGNLAGRVGLVSLFSWVYSALPPDPVNFVTTMRNLTEHQQMLRVEQKKLDDLKKSIAGITDETSIKAQTGRVILSRLEAGYTISRWRAQTGEETAAFTRGPLVPIPQPTDRPPAPDLPDCSNTSQAYQILDSQTGMMDLTYSTAWQAGKILAISDTNFSAALMRFRSKVYDTIASRTRMKLNGIRHTRRLVSSLTEAVGALNSASTASDLEPSRVRPNDTDRSVTLLRDDDAAETLQKNTEAVVGYNTKAGSEGFNEVNRVGPNNSDWAIIHCWLADKLLLGGIPSQYLLPESSYLPRESLRFFYIDDFWLDCLIDGALSIANHLDGDDDRVRREMKKIFNVYLSSQMGSNPDRKPQIPCYGFIMRSQLVKAMPDMKIEVRWKTGGPADPRAPVCRWSKWDEQTLLGLLDRPPQELDAIILKQPDHQQRFSLGSGMKTSSQPDGTPVFGPLQFELRKLYTEPTPPRVIPEIWDIMPAIDIETGWYDVESRAINLKTMATAVNYKLRNETFDEITDEHSRVQTIKPIYKDETPNSCEFGLELNDPCYFFRIVPPASGPDIPTTPRKRQLYVKEPKLKPTPLPPSEGPTQPPEPPTPPPPNPSPQDPPSTPPVIIPTAPDRQPRIQPLPQFIAQANARATTTTVQSRFDLRIFADYKGLPKRYPQDKYDPNDFIPTQNIYFFDLIFSIRKKLNFQQSLFDLVKIVIDIPVASDPNARTEALLTPNYDGPGLRMLSNQRFIPFLYHDVPSAPLHIELIPRSADDDYALKINDRKTREMGFRLAEANVSPVLVNTDVQIEGERFRQPRGKVIITMTEYYKVNTPEGVDAVSTQYRLIKKEVQDDVELDDDLLP